MKTSFVMCLTIAPLLLNIPVIDAVPVEAQQIAQSSSFGMSNADLVKARNLARQTIETKNGGIRRYRAEKSMHGPVKDAPFTQNEDGTLTFTFLGGTPAKAPTIESVVTVNPSNWTTQVDYNGAIRR